MDQQPKIIVEPLFTTGQNNSGTREIQIQKEQTSRDLSTVCVVPSRGMMPSRVVQSWMGMMPPMNQKFTRIFILGVEVGEAYNQAIQMILGNSELKKWKYILTLEDDNMPPPDGLLKLYESIEGGVDGVKYDVVGGLYWTKGEGGQPMCYGKPEVFPMNFIPFLPPAQELETKPIVRANGLGMGFNLWRVSMFKDKKLRQPWFKTQQEVTHEGVKSYTQDLYFYEDAGKHGYKFACDSRVRVGHFDSVTDRVW